MNVLELYAGSRSFGKVAEQYNMNVFSVDWIDYDNIDLQIDIEKIKMSDIPFVPDIIWASPDCTTYSLAGVSHHRDNQIAISDYAKKCDNTNVIMWNLINDYLILNPAMKYFVENPRGMMRKMDFVKHCERATIWYCRYNSKFAKPTDIFTNHLHSMFNTNGWIPRPRCFNGNQKCHHEASPRGTTSGINGIVDTYEKSIIPHELCDEIIKSCINAL